MEFPAVSQSRKEFWSAPQYTRNGMLILTLFLGFFGFHHLMLRSPQTALFMLIANFLLLGYPWLYDIIQLLPESWGGHGTEALNKYGMGHAFGALGLGQGMWLPDNYVAPEKEPDDAPPNPIWFILYVLFIPIGFLASLFAGDNWGAFAKFGYLTFIPLGWFLGLLSTVYDLFYLFLKPADLFVFGLKRFFPWPLLGMDKDMHSPGITGVRPPVPNPCPPSDNFLVGTLKFFLRTALPILYLINPALGMSVETAVTSATTGAGVVGDVADAIAGTAKKLGDATKTTADIATDTATAVLEDGSKIAKTVGKLAVNLDNIAGATLSSMDSLPIPPHIPKQLGGGQSNSSFSALDYAAFGTISAVIGGAFLLSAGRSYGGVAEQNDTPPNARAI